MTYRFDLRPRIEAAVRLYSEGVRMDEIGARTGVNRCTVRRNAAKAGIPPRKLRRVRGPTWDVVRRMYTEGGEKISVISTLLGIKETTLHWMVGDMGLKSTRNPRYRGKGNG